MQLFLSFGQLFAALFVFPQELPMLLKERSSDMYRLSAYYIARSIATLGLDLLYPTVRPSSSHLCRNVTTFPIWLALLWAVSAFDVLCCLSTYA